MGANMRGHRSLKATADEIADDWSGTVTFETGTGVEYAAYMEFGTRPHSITPDTAPVLHFWVDGVEVVTDFVQHPGTEPRPYMQPGAEGAAREASAIVASEDDLEGVVEALAEKVQEIAQRLAPKDTGRLRASITVRRVG